MDFEIGHMNIFLTSEEDKKAAVAAIKEKQSRELDEGVAGCPWEDDAPIVDWHTDSYPFVCVLMLSDCTNMVGGETALRTGFNTVMKVRGPQMVSHTTLLDLPMLTKVRALLVSSKVDTSSTKLFALLAPTNASPWSPLSGPNQP